MSPKIVDREAKRKQITQAAMSVFARLGIDNAKMTDIASAAGIGKGTIYEYFRSKDEVFAAAFELFQEEMDAEIGRRIWGVADPEEKLRVLVGTFVDIILKHHTDFVEIMLEFWAEGIRRGHEVLDMKSMYEKYRQYIAAFLEEGVEKGAFRPLDAALVASTILGALDGLMLQWFLDREVFDLDRAGEELTRIVLEGIEA